MKIMTARGFEPYNAHDSVPAEDRIGRLVGEHQRRRDELAGGHAWKRGGIDHAQLLDVGRNWLSRALPLTSASVNSSTYRTSARQPSCRSTYS